MIALIGAKQIIKSPKLWRIVIARKFVEFSWQSIMCLWIASGCRPRNDEKGTRFAKSRNVESVVDCIARIIKTPRNDKILQKLPRIRILINL